MHADAVDKAAEPARAAWIIGVDPGLRCTGYAVLRRGPRGPILCEAGVVRIAAHGPLEQRLARLERELDALLADQRPAVLACEQLYAHYRHPRTAILMGHARGVILALAGRREMAVISLGATHVKKLLTGRGHASKAQMQRAVAGTLGLARLPAPHDVADAIAVALAGARACQARDHTLQAAPSSAEHAENADGRGRRAERRGRRGAANRLRANRLARGAAALGKSG